MALSVLWNLVHGIPIYLSIARRLSNLDSLAILLGLVALILMMPEFLFMVLEFLSEVPFNHGEELTY